jgi:hypothetical protein
MTADDLDLRSRTSSLGNDLKKFIDELKSLADLLPLLVKIAAFIGGALLVGYAAKEHFFYDLSSIAAISLLFITFFAFSLILIALVIYSFLSMLWIAVVIYRVMSWYRRIRSRTPLVRQLRPEITRGRVAFSLLLFLWMALLLATKWAAAAQPMVEYMIGTGLLISIFVVSSRLPGEKEKPRLLFAFLGLPILMLFMFSGPPSVFGSLLNSTMTILSFRSAPDQLVSLNEQAYDKVRTIAAYAGVTVSPCKVAKDVWVLREATLV